MLLFLGTVLDALSVTTFNICIINPPVMGILEGFPVTLCPSDFGKLAQYYYLVCSVPMGVQTTKDRLT